MEGMIRALQPDIMGYTSLLMFALVVFVGFRMTARFAVKPETTTLDDPDAKMIRKVGNYITLTIVAITVLIAVLRIVEYSAVNRMPRNAVDGSEVYDRMKQNTEPLPPQREPTHDQ